PWYPEAVKLLNENPRLEVGLHLVLTSEWEAYKWRPLTDAPSIVDENGYFYPMTWPNENYPDSVALINVSWDSEEVERELRAQIDRALEDIPHINHLSSHMYVINSSPEFREVFEKVAHEYTIKLADQSEVQRIRFGGKEKSAMEKEAELVRIVEELEPGTWMLVDHPAFDTPEMQAITHIGYENVAADRAGVTVAFTSEKVMEVIRKRGIELITYQDLLNKEQH
ncbi:MAG: ChbG/HpnK family deacetylase, partial [Bacteroidales bacterium]|nr:ChbG/HpnK family deacetylase [Bacteroidales bacterium]